MNHVKVLGVIFDKRIIQRLHIEITEAKAFRTIITVYSLIKSERLIANIKRILHEALIISVMTYACPACEFSADTEHLKLQHLQNKGLHTIGTFPRCTTLRDLHVAS
jgi:hypothetical protein